MSSRATEKLIILPRHFYLRGRLLAWLAVLTSLAGGVAIGWYLGSYQSQLLVEQNARQLQNQLDNANERVLGLDQQVTGLKRSRAIDEAAKLNIQTTIQELEGKIVQLNEDLAFYKNIMAPGANHRGLKIQKLELQPGREARVFKYKLVLTQVADNSNYISGVVAVNLIGTRNNVSELLSLRDVGGTKDLGLKFRFRYFQDIQGELTLPSDFQVSQVQVVAQARGKKTAKIERTFEWVVGG